MQEQIKWQLPGIIPTKNNQKEIIGAIGVTGSLVEKEYAVASAGIES